MIFKGKNGREYSIIDPPIGKGGEGAVYKVNGAPDCVLKVFNDDKRNETRHRKLLAMINSPMPPDAMQQVTWPMDVVYDGGCFAGYVMPAIKNNEDLNVIYSDKYSYTLAEKITIAKNLCSAINAVHNAGQVCGDLNPKNISVDPRHAIVTLVDTDSYHITDQMDSKVYRCEVGLPEYLPKEIQVKMKNGMNLKSAPLPTFTKYSDRFALAVHIFALLMNGCHPFACAVNNNVNIGPLASSQPSVVAPQPIDNICNDFFPFANTKAGITTPQYAPDFNALPSEIQKMFMRAFVSGGQNPSERPDTVDWYNALTKMQNNLKTCRINRQHMYAGHLSECPWCKVEAKMRAVSAPRLVQTSINTNQQYIPRTSSTGAPGRSNATTGGHAATVSSQKRGSAGNKISLFLGIFSIAIGILGSLSFGVIGGVAGLFLGVFSIIKGINARKHGQIYGSSDFVCGIIGTFFSAFFIIGCIACGGSHGTWGCIGGSNSVVKDAKGDPDLQDVWNELEKALQDAANNAD